MPMGTSANVIELKYREILEYQEVVTNAAMQRMALDTVESQVLNIGLAAMTGLLLECLLEYLYLIQTLSSPVSDGLYYSVIWLLRECWSWRLVIIPI